MFLKSCLVFVFYSIFAKRLKGITAAADDEGNELTSRIFFGTAINSFEYPFFAILEGCGGAIISEWWIVTAAHCVVADVLVAPFYPKYVCVGGTTESNCYGYTFNKIIIHPGYMTNEVKDDIALLKLTTQLRFSSEIQKVYLPRTRQFFSGWLTLVAKGLDETNHVSDVVQMVNLYAYDGDSCSETGHGEGFCAIRSSFQPGTCFGDSGSPMVRDGTLIGLVSAIGNKKCGQNKYTYGVNIAYYVPWIKLHTGII